MKILDINTLKEFNERYEYNLPEITLTDILNCLKANKRIDEFDILQEFEYYAN